MTGTGDGSPAGSASPRAPGLVRAASLFLSAGWFGAVAFFALAGARIVLRVSASRHAGGAVNRALLDSLDLLSLVAAFLLLAAALHLGRKSAISSGARALAVRLSLLAAAAAAASLFVITPEMWQLRGRMPMAIELVPKDDPLRMAWGRLHGVSTLALLVRVAAAAGLFAAFLPRGGPDAA